jgi:hypothetical protein
MPVSLSAWLLSPPPWPTTVPGNLNLHRNRRSMNPPPLINACIYNQVSSAALSDWASGYTGTFSPRAQNFVIADGKFESVTNINHPAPTASWRKERTLLSAFIQSCDHLIDFRNIPLRELDLLSEIRLNRATYLRKWETQTGRDRFRNLSLI